ncbi:MAG TPA: membrane-bound PQQ-dependent dehydrogenase, glucose/quinate/shikimate family [Novosphingobium sp.]|nr:membrane-bound PQQ-dependent dehydrogenase, glucose/quinate/shikimate family [Novosphingobium sp.]
MALLFALCAVGIGYGGIVLVALGGSAFFLIEAALLLGVAMLLWRGNGWALWLHGALLGLVLAWSCREAGLDPWALVPRLGLPYLLGLLLLMPAIAGRLAGGPGWPRGIRRAMRGLLAAALVGVPAAALLGHGYAEYGPPYQPPSAHGADASGAGADWADWGGNGGGTHFSRLAEITPANVGQLQEAWRFSFGQRVKGGLEGTPLKIGDALYACDSTDQLVALDPETGRVQWRFDPHVRLDAPFRACRGIGYYRLPGRSGPCAERLYLATVDARLIAVDAHGAGRCADFGQGGDVDALAGLGDVPRGYYWFNSAPNVFAGRIIVSGSMVDNQYWGQPSGVVRAYDAVSGQLAWAYDAGAPERRGAPPAGQSYTRATPNAWAQMTFDPALGLLYVATGNATPDYYGAQRRPFDDETSSAVLALDMATGRRRWLFQTTHHDLWDYDVGAQPVLFDYAGADGRSVHALAQPTKRAEVFLLDRATGHPLGRIEERPAPTAGHAAGERVSPTQPFPADFPSLAGPPLSEARMWGLTPFDQLWCRIQFRRARYDGALTPPGEQPGITYPGYLGGMDWGGVSVDTDRAIMVAVSAYVPNYTRLVPRAQAGDVRPMSKGREGLAALEGLNAMAGTPYASSTKPFLSPLQVPCNQPPWGRLSAIDLKTNRLIWSRPLGTGRDNGPLGIATRLPLTIGAPVMGGALATRGGLTFVGASTDRSFRAFATASGRLLWQADLPHSGNAVPMSYLSRASGRQFVVIAAGGHASMGAEQGDDLVAYALPRQH